MNPLMSNSTAAMLEAINKSHSLDEAIKIVKQIDALKAALESVDNFRNQSVLYARLEAEALIKVVELGGLNKLRGNHRATAEWLSSLSDAEREKYISMCLEGLTIDQVYKREVGFGKEKIKQISLLKEMRKEMITELKTTGITDITPFAQQARKAFWDDLSTANDLIDGARNAIRGSGGIGIGDETGIYVTATKGAQEEIKKAILLRFDSVRRDLEQIQSIAKASKVKMSYTDFVRGESWALENSPELIHILLLLSRINLIDSEIYDKITIAEARKEMDYVRNVLKVSREKYIINQYRQLECVGEANKT